MHHELQLALDFVEFEMREHRAHQQPRPLLELRAAIYLLSGRERRTAKQEETAA